VAKLAQLSPLAAVAVPGRYGNATGTTVPVTLKERSGLKLRVIAALSRQGPAVEDMVRKITGLELPRGPKRVVAKGLALIGTAPGQWLAVAEDESSRQMLEALAKQLVGHAAITEQSDSKAVIRISGARARDVMAIVVEHDVECQHESAGILRTDQPRQIAQFRHGQTSTNSVRNISSGSSGATMWFRLKR